jgi:hypothetical protein
MVRALVGVMVTAVAMVSPAAAESVGHLNVVIVLQGAIPGHLMVAERVRAALAPPVLGPIQIHTEFLEESHFPGGLSSERCEPERTHLWHVCYRFVR